MDVNHINPFLEAFTFVMPKLGLTDVKKNGILVKGRFIESPGVIIIVGITGDIKGNVIYATSIDTSKRIASIMMGIPVTELDDLAQSAISELINMLAANATLNFSNQAINIKISTPTLMQGNFTANSSLDKVLCVQMLVSGMDFQVNLALDNN